MGRVEKAAEKDWFRSVAFLVISSHPHHHLLLALREGGVAGAEGWPAPKERPLSLSLSLSGAREGGSV